MLSSHCYTPAWHLLLAFPDVASVLACLRPVRRGQHHTSCHSSASATLFPLPSFPSAIAPQRRYQSRRRATLAAKHTRMSVPHGMHFCRTLASRIDMCLPTLACDRVQVHISSRSDSPQTMSKLPSIHYSNFFCNLFLACFTHLS